MTTTISPKNNPLTALLEQAQQALRQERQVEAARFEAGRQAIRKAAAAALGDLWEAVAPHASADFNKRRSGPVRNLEALYTFRLPDEMCLATMYLTVRARLDSQSEQWSVSDIYWSYANGSRRRPVEQTARALLDARREWEEADFRQREKQAKSIVSPLELYHSAPKEESEALALVEQATAICPERADEWQRSLDRWREIRADQTKQERTARKRSLIATLYGDIVAAEDEDWLQSHIAMCRREFPEDNNWDKHEAGARAQILARRAYRQASTTVAQQRMAALADNRRKAAAWLEELSVPVPAHELTYGVCAEDEDGERYASTRSVIVLNEHPDGDGYWDVVRHGVIERVRYLHPVSVTPATAPVKHFGFVPELGQTVDYPCTRRREEIRQAIAALELSPLPPLPAVPEALDRSAADEILRSVREAFPDAFRDEVFDDVPW